MTTTTQKAVDLPIVLNGREVWPGSDRERFEISYDSGLTIALPRLKAEDVGVLEEGDPFVIHDLHHQEIISFVLKVGRFWDPSNAGHPLYAQALELLSLVHGYSPKMAQREINLSSAMMLLSPAWHDLLDFELGSRHYLEEWLPRGDALVHAQPMGNLVHILVGNVPASGVFSIIRSLITKNRTLAKLPRRDPITTLFLIRSFLEVDPEHPVTRSLSGLYWPAGDALGQQVLDLADMVCVWGGGDAVREIKRSVAPSVEVLAFGPRSSFAVIGKECVHDRDVALRVAHDMSIYNQEACFSPQMMFVEGDHEVFLRNLNEGLGIFSRLLPKGTVTLDTRAHVSRSRLEATFAGHQVEQSPGTDWTVVVAPNPEAINEHPLSRTIFLIPVQDIRECLPYVSRDTQTISIAPWNRSVELRDEATLRGADKLTEVGMVQTSRVGAPHDSVYPLARMVRWVGVERGSDYWGKYVQQGPIDVVKWIMMNEAQLEDVATFEQGEDGDDSAS